MTSAIKPIQLYGHAQGPNPWKVVILFEELGLPYETTYKDMHSVKQAEYEKINPNGRVPAIEDPNTGITLWESAAILEYIVDTYDKEKKFTYTTFPEKWHVKQWLAFQISGQGPYFGQAMWFAHFHGEKIPSAIERYEKEVLRVLYVLNKGLEGKEYLVGNKVTIADLAFISWLVGIPHLFGDRLEGLEIDKTYPNYSAWLQRLLARPAVAKSLNTKQELMKQGH